jgi:hypothetical protein
VIVAENGNDGNKGKFRIRNSEEGERDEEL